MTPTGRATSLYRALLRLAPRTLRTTYGDEMVALFSERLAEARRSGRLAALAVWVAAIADITGAAVGHARLLPDERMLTMSIADVKYTVRWLFRQRFSTSLIVAMLAIAIAANVVVFSLVNGLFLRPFPFPNPDRLVYINETAPRWNLDITGINFPDFHQWHRDARLFEAIALYDLRTLNLSDRGGAQRIDGAGVTFDFAKVLGVQPLLGRMFTSDEDRPGAAKVVVIGERLWHDRFGGSPGVIGVTMKLDSIPHTIVGVMPRAAEFPQAVQLWVPFAGDPNSTEMNYGQEALGRLKPGVTVEDAEKDLLRAHEPVWQTREKERAVSPFVKPVRAQFVRNVRVIAQVLLGATVLLLVVACANVASLMLARALVRRREMGIRLAIGASRLRLLRQLLVENVLLAAIGGALGLALGQWTVVALLRWAGDRVPPWTTFEFDPRVLAFSVALILLTVVLFGWAPALHALRGDLRAAMHHGTAGAISGPGGRRTLRLLVAAEFALAAVLVVAGGLFVRAYTRVQNVDPGFNAARVLTFNVALPSAVYVGRPARLAFWDRLEARIASIPGVEAAGVINCPPLTCHWGTFFVAEGAPPPQNGQNPVVLFRPTSPGYFPTMGIRLKAGRFLEPNDGRNSARVAVVNETFVKTFWPQGSDVVGRRFRAPGQGTPWVTVVGVVTDVKHYGLEKPMRPGIYIPVPDWPADSLSVVVRTVGDPTAIVAAARAAVGELDPELPLYQVRTMDDLMARSLSQRTLYSWLVAVFATIALVLALGGAYGVTTYVVSQRTRELGIRVALGARRADILRAVLRGGLMPVAIGIVLGIAGSLVASRPMAELLFDVKPNDLQVLGGAVVLLVALSVLTTWLPARRAAAVDPMRSLRME